MTAPLVQATGRRKRSVARVRLRIGAGTITINGRTVEDYFPSRTHQMLVVEPLTATAAEGRYDMDATIGGGGSSGQAGALRLGISRGLVEVEPELRDTLDSPPSGLRRRLHAPPRLESTKPRVGSAPSPRSM